MVLDDRAEVVLSSGLPLVNHGYNVYGKVKVELEEMVRNVLGIKGYPDGLYISLSTGMTLETPIQGNGREAPKTAGSIH